MSANKLSKVNKIKLVRDLRHDVLNQLTVMMAMGQMLERRVGEKERGYVEKLRERGKDLEEMINIIADLIEWSLQGKVDLDGEVEVKGERVKVNLRGWGRLEMYLGTGVWEKRGKRWWWVNRLEEKERNKWQKRLDEEVGVEIEVWLCKLIVEKMGGDWVRKNRVIELRLG